MARYKVLKSVAHNIGHSFTSLMNYAGDDYVMGHILRFARRTEHDTLTIDFVKREADPSELLAPPISEVPARYTEWFWDLVQRHGSDRSLVQSATLTLRYDIATSAHFVRTRNTLRVLSRATFALRMFAARTIWHISTAGGIPSASSVPKSSPGPGGSSGLLAST
jgi:hypothetical protein